MKNIIVMDASGNTIGLTYPRRARGLIKAGRAVPAGESGIRLTGTGSSAYKEDTNMPINICFKPEDFTADKAFPGTVLTRRFLSAAPGGMPTETLILRGSGEQPGGITCQPIPLSSGQAHALTLWILPGEGAQICWKIRYADADAPVCIPLEGDGWTFCTVPFGGEPGQEAASLTLEVTGGCVTLLPGQDPAERPVITDVQEIPESPDIPAPAETPAPSPVDDARAQMLRTLTGRLEALDMSQPWCVDAMKEMKDMIERILRQY